MTQENVEVMREGIDTWNRDDRDEWLAVFARKPSGIPPAASRIGAATAGVKRWPDTAASG